MLFFLILHMKLSYFFSSLRILSVLSTLYYKRSFFFMFKAFHKLLNFHSQLILIIVDLTSFCCIIINSYSSLCNMIRDWSLVCDVEWNLLLIILLLADLNIINWWFILCVQFNQSLLHSISDWKFSYKLQYLQLHSIILRQRQAMLVSKIERQKYFLNLRMFSYDLRLNWVARHFLTCIMRDHWNNQCIH